MKRILALTVAAIMLTACSGGAEPTPETNEQAVSLNIDAPKVTLVSAGEGTQTVINYQDAGASQQVTVTFTDGFDQGTGEDDTLPKDPPDTLTTDTFTTSLDATVSEQSPRDITLKLGQSEHSNPSYANDVASLQGFELGWVAKPSGQVDTVRLAAPSGATDQGRSLAELYLMKLLAQPIVFPTEPIAPGATWTVDNRVTGDSTMLRTTTYTLDSLRDGVAELSLTAAERPAVGALPVSELGDNAELKVVSSRSHGVGKLRVDLSKPLPTAGEVTLNTRVMYGEDGKTTRVFQDFNSGAKFS